MSSERKYLGSHAFIRPVDLTQPQPQAQIAEIKPQKRGILSPLAFWRKKQEIAAVNTEMQAEPVETNNITIFPTHEIIVAEEPKVVQFPVRVAMAKGVRKADKVQAKIALEALVEMNRNSNTHEQVGYDLIPRMLNKGHAYDIEEYAAEDVPMQKQNMDVSGQVKEDNNGTVMAYQFVAHQELLLPSSSEENLAMITNRHTDALVRAADQTPRESNAINMAVVIEELGANLLSEAELTQLPDNDNLIVKPNDFWGNNDQKSTTLHPENISYMEDYKGKDLDDQKAA